MQRKKLFSQRSVVPKEGRDVLHPLTPCALKSGIHADVKGGSKGREALLNARCNGVIVTDDGIKDI